MSESVKPAGGRRPFGDHLFDVYLTRSYHELHDEAFEIYGWKYENLDEDGKVAWIDNLYHYMHTCFATEYADDAFSTMDCFRYEGDLKAYGEYAVYLEFLVKCFDQYWGHLSHEMSFEDSAKLLKELLEFSLEHDMHAMSAMFLNKIGNMFTRFKCKDLAFNFYDLSVRYLLSHRQKFTDSGLLHLAGYPLSNLVSNIEDLELRNRTISVMTTFYAPIDLASKEYLFDMLHSQLSQEKTDYVVGDHEGSHVCFSSAPKCYDYQYRLRYKSTYDSANNNFNKNEHESQENGQVEGAEEENTSKKNREMPPIRDFLDRIYSAYRNEGKAGAKKAMKSLNYDEKKINQIYYWWLVGDEVQGDEYVQMEKYVRDCNMKTRYSDLNLIFGYLNTESQINAIPNYLNNVLRTVTPISFSDHGNMIGVLFNNSNLFYDRSALAKMFCLKSGAGMVYSAASEFVDLIRKYTDDTFGLEDCKHFFEEILDACRIGGRKFSDRHKTMIVNAICTRKDPQSVLSQNIESIIANMDCIKEYVSESDRVRIDMNLILWASSDKRNKYLNEIEHLLSDEDTAREFAVSFNRLTLNKFNLFPDQSLNDLVLFYNNYAGLRLSIPQVPSYNEISELNAICVNLLKDYKGLADVFRTLGFGHTVNESMGLCEENPLKSNKQYHDIREKMRKRGWIIDETHTNVNIIRVEIPDTENPEQNCKLLIYMHDREGSWMANEKELIWKTDTGSIVSPVQTLLMHRSEYGLYELSRSPIVVLMEGASVSNFIDAVPYWQNVSVVSYYAFDSALDDDKQEKFINSSLDEDIYKLSSHQESESKDNSNNENTSRLTLSDEAMSKAKSSNEVFMLTSREKLMAMTTKEEDISTDMSYKSKIDARKKSETSLVAIRSQKIKFSSWDFYRILSAYRGGYDFINNCNEDNLGFIRLLHMVINSIDSERKNTKGSYLLSMADRQVRLDFCIKDYAYKFTVQARSSKSGSAIDLSVDDFRITRMSESEQYLISGYKKNRETEGYHLVKGDNVFVGNVHELLFEVVLHIDGTIHNGAAMVIMDKLRSQLRSCTDLIMKGYEGSIRGFQEEKNMELAISVAKAAIMSRNMSHNLGSHVMAYLKQGLKGEADPSYLAGVGRFVSYLQERQDFIATIATDYIPYFSSVNFKDAIYDELNPDLRHLRHGERSGEHPENLLLKYIALSEGLSRSSDPEKKDDNQIFISFRDFNGLNDYKSSQDRIDGCPAPPAADLEAMRKFNVCLPGGVVGRQAIFSIVENVIRNSAKHGNWREKKFLNIRFDLLDIDDLLKDNDMLKHLVLKGYITESEDGKYDFSALSDYYVFTITDNLDIAPGAFSSLEQSLKEGYVREDGEMINAHKGIKEIRISAAWLRGISNDLHLKAGLPPVVTVRNVEPGLQYVFCLHKVKDVLIVTDRQIASLPAGWNCKTLNEYLASDDKSYNLVLVENEEVRAKIEELSPDRIVVCPSDLWRKICDSGDCDFEDVRSKLYAKCYGVKPDSPDLYIVDAKVSKDSVVTGKVHLCYSDSDVDSGKCQYVYRTHHRDDAEFMAFMDCPCYGDDVTVEGISGNDSTDRLLRNELIDDLWYYRHLAALRTEAVVFDERLFSRVSGLKDEDLMSYSGLSRILSDKQTGLEEKKVKVCEFRGYKRMWQKKTIMCHDNLKDLAGALGINPDITVDADRLMLVYRQKRISLCNVIYNPAEQVFDIFGCVGGRRVGDSYVSVVSRIGSISRSQDMKGIDVVLCDGADGFSGLAEYISAHQGLMDKIYTKFGLRGSVESMCSVTASLYSAFSMHAASYENVPVERFRRGFFIHSGRSKPSPSDMPQRQPFIQFAAIENAVLDCKYSLIELFKSARYE